MDIITVRWQDICTVRETSTPENEQLIVVESVGFEVNRDNKNKLIRLCQSFSDDDGIMLYKDLTVIPLSVVIEIKKLVGG